MIATRRGLAIACGVVGLLAIALGVDVARRPEPEDRALLPGFDAGAVSAMVWHRPGKPDVRLSNRGLAWMIVPPGVDPPARGFVPEPGAVHDVLDSLRGARWHRRGDAKPSHATLELQTPRGAHVIGIGEPLAGTEQVWLTVDGRAVLVDRWVATTLADAPDHLRVAVPFEAPAAFASIDVEVEAEVEAGVQLRVMPHPWRITKPALLIAAARATAFEHALAEVTLVRFSDTPSHAQGLTITAHQDDPRDVQLTVGGACPGDPALIAVSGTYGDGCITAEAAAAVAHASSGLQVIEARPAPIEPAQIKLADGTALDVTRGRIGDDPADPAKVAALVAALSTPGTPVPRPAGTPSSTLTVTGRDGAAITVELLGGDLVARPGESLALKLAPGAVATLTRPARALRELSLWLEEPTTISAVTVDDVRYQRGAVIGDWTRSPAGPVNPGALEALLGQLAAPHPLGELAAITVVHRVTLTVIPPTGTPTGTSTGTPITHALGIGAPRPDGCPVQHDHDALLLPAALCAALAKI